MKSHEEVKAGEKEDLTWPLNAELVGWNGIWEAGLGRYHSDGNSSD